MAGKRWVELDAFSRLLMRADALAPEALGALMEHGQSSLKGIGQRPSKLRVFDHDHDHDHVGRRAANAYAPSPCGAPD
jgi:hypothetical protein